MAQGGQTTTPSNTTTVTNPSFQPAPAPPAANPFNDAQLRVLAAVADTVMAAHTGEEAEEILKELYNGKGSPPDVSLPCLALLPPNPAPILGPLEAMIDRDPPPFPRGLWMGNLF